MAYTVFDGVAKFTADSSQLDQFIVKLEQGLTNASEKAAASTRDLKSAQDEFRASIKAVSAEGGNTTTNLQQLADAEKNLALAAAAAKQEHAALKDSLSSARQAADDTSGSMSEARGAITLLGEEIGVRVPRHVATFLAGIPGVQTALSAAFAPVAIIALVEIGAKLIDKIQEIRKNAEEVAAAWQKVQDDGQQAFTHTGDEILQVGTQIDELSGNKLAALQKNLQLIDHASLSELAKQVQQIAKDTDDAFTKMQTWWDWLTTMGQGNAGIKSVQSDFDNLTKSYQNLLKFGTENPDPFGSLKNSIDGAKQKLAELQDKQKQASGEQKAAIDEQVAAQNRQIASLQFLQDQYTQAKEKLASLNAEHSKQVTLAETSAELGGREMAGMQADAEKKAEALAKEIDAQNKLVNGLGIYVNLQLQSNKLEQEKLTIATSKGGGNFEKQQADAANNARDQQLADIEKWKAGVHLAYASGQVDAADWQVAELRAVNAANVAHEDYLQKLIAIYQKAGDTAKAQAAQEQLNTLQTKDQTKATDDLAAAVEKHRQEVGKLTAEWDKLAAAGVAKDFEATKKAVEDLAKSEEELAKAQGKLAETQGTQNFAAQEEAIKQLAQIGLITEEQKAQKLRALYQQEENDAINALRQMQQKVAVESAKGNTLFGTQQLADLQKNLKAAEGDFGRSIAIIKTAFANVEKSNPFLTPAQIDELHAQLNRVLAAFTSTQTQITSTQEKFDKERLASQQGTLARAIAIATAAGKEELAQDLQNHQAKLDLLNDEIILARAKGQSTAALESEKQATEQETQALIKQTQGVASHRAELGRQLLAEMQLTEVRLAAINNEIRMAQARNEDTAALVKQRVATEQQTQALLKQIQALTSLGNADTKFGKGAQVTWASFTADLQNGVSGIQQLKAVGIDAFNSLSQAMQSAVAAAILSQDSFGAALEKATAQALASIAAQSLVKALFYTAEGFAALAGFADSSAAEYFEAAGIMAAVGGGAAVAAHAMSGGSSSSSATSSTGATTSTSTATNSTAGPQPVQVQNVQHFASGGVASIPTLAVIGDSEHGGAASEAVIPLENRGALNAIADALVPALLLALMKSQGSQPGLDSTPNLSVPRFFDGGLITGPLLAMLGDSRSGSAATEAVLPLENDSTMARIASSIASQFRVPATAERRYEPGATSALLSNSTLATAGSAIEHSLAVQRSEEYGTSPAKGTTDVQAIATAFAKALNEKTPMSGQINISLESDIPQLVKKINHQVSTGRARLLASNSIRVTRRS